MCFCGHRHRVAGLETPFFALAVGKRELRTALGEKNCEARGMAVHDGFLVRSVFHAEHPYVLIFKFDAVMVRVHAYRIGRRRPGSWSSRHIHLLWMDRRRFAALGNAQRHEHSPMMSEQQAPRKARKNEGVTAPGIG